MLLQIVLESPLDIFCFKWNPTQPNIIAAGAASGQVLIYDVQDAMNLLSRSKSKSHKSSHAQAAESVRWLGMGGSAEVARVLSVKDLVCMSVKRSVCCLVAVCLGGQERQVNSCPAQVYQCD